MGYYYKCTGKKKHVHYSEEKLDGTSRECLAKRLGNCRGHVSSSNFVRRGDYSGEADVYIFRQPKLKSAAVPAVQTNLGSSSGVGDGQDALNLPFPPTPPVVSNANAVKAPEAEPNLKRSNQVLEETGSPVAPVSLPPTPSPLFKKRRKGGEDDVVNSQPIQGGSSKSDAFSQEYIGHNEAAESTSFFSVSFAVPPVSFTPPLIINNNAIPALLDVPVVQHQQLPFSGEAKSQVDLTTYYSQEGSVKFLLRDGSFGSYRPSTSKMLGNEAVDEPGMLSSGKYVKNIFNNMIYGRVEFGGLGESKWRIIGMNGTKLTGELTWPDFLLQVSGVCYSVELKVVKSDIFTYLSNHFYDERSYGDEGQFRPVQKEIECRANIINKFNFGIRQQLVLDIRDASEGSFDAALKNLNTHISNVMDKNYSYENKSGFWNHIHSVRFFYTDGKLSPPFTVRELSVKNNKNLKEKVNSGALDSMFFKK